MVTAIAAAVAALREQPGAEAVAEAVAGLPGKPATPLTRQLHAAACGLLATPSLPASETACLGFWAAAYSDLAPQAGWRLMLLAVLGRCGAAAAGRPHCSAAE